MTESTYVAVLDSQGRVIYSAQIPHDTTRIDVAGAVAHDGTPVNVKSFRVSRSRRNLAAASDSFRVNGLRRMDFKGREFYVSAEM